MPGTRGPRLTQALNVWMQEDTLLSKLLRFDQLIKLKSKNQTIFKRICWVTRTTDPSTKHLNFQVRFFFQNFLKNALQKSFQFIFLFFIILQKLTLKVLSTLSVISNYEKK